MSELHNPFHLLLSVDSIVKLLSLEILIQSQSYLMLPNKAIVTNRLVKWITRIQDKDLLSLPFI